MYLYSVLICFTTFELLSLSLTLKWKWKHLASSLPLILIMCFDTKLRDIVFLIFFKLICMYKHPTNLPFSSSPLSSPSGLLLFTEALLSIQSILKHQQNTQTWSLCFCKKNQPNKINLSTHRKPCSSNEKQHFLHLRECVLTVVRRSTSLHLL